ncbi:MAG: DUF4388 domain-containing protein [Proteobacteria bacterium]|nr:DUF4388 domain-containing protein [Pseudomonadota bacterium]
MDMTVRGALRTMSAEDILEWVDRRRVSGSLIVEWSSLIRKFVFDSGVVASAASNEPSEHVGHLLMRAGFIDKETLDDVLASQATSELGLRHLLRTKGAVSDESVRQVLEEQAREALCDAMAWTEGTFVMERSQECPVEVGIPLSVAIGPCIAEARRRAIRWHQIHRMIPSEDVVLTFADRDLVFNDDDNASTRRELSEIAAAIDRGSSVGQIVLERYHRRFSALDHLVQLIERGAAALPGQATAQPSDTVSLEDPILGPAGPAPKEPESVGRARADSQDSFLGPAGLAADRPAAPTRRAKRSDSEQGDRGSEAEVRMGRKKRRGSRRMSGVFARAREEQRSGARRVSQAFDRPAQPPSSRTPDDGSPASGRPDSSVLPESPGRENAENTGDTAETLLRAARHHADGGDRDAAFEMASRALSREPENSTIQEAYRDFERALFAQLCRDLLTSFRVPKLLVDRTDLDAIELTDNERYLASRIDGRWDLLSLMRVSPLREVEALITFKRLADRGIISL